MPMSRDWTQIQAQINKYSKPQKNYNDESFRRSMLSDYTQLGQQYQANDYERGENMTGLRNDVINTGLSTNNVRSSYVGDAFNEGMRGVNYKYKMGLQNIRNNLTGLANQEWAYKNQPRGGGGGGNPAKAPVFNAPKQPAKPQISDAMPWDVRNRLTQDYETAMRAWRAQYNTAYEQWQKSMLSWANSR